MAENEKQLLEYCKQLIEDKLNWGNSEKWRNKEFIDLSDTIYEATQVRISVSTLKRLWGRIRYDGAPNHYTLDALASYIGYYSWKHFKTLHYGNIQTISQRELLEEVTIESQLDLTSHEVVAQSADTLTKIPTINSTSHQDIESSSLKDVVSPPSLSTPIASGSSSGNRHAVWLYGGLIFLGTVLGFVIALLVGLLNNNKNEVNFLVDPPKTILFAYPSIAEDYPVKVKFFYDISAVQEATPKGWHLTNILSFGHDTRAKLIYSGKEKGETDYIYPEPGIYNAKIFTNIKQTSEVSILVKSRGWITNIDMKDSSLTVDNSDTIFYKNKGLTFTKNDLKHFLAKFDSSVVGWVSYSKFDNFGVSADNCLLTADIKRPTNADGGLNTVDIRIRGKKSSLHIQFIGKGFRDKIYLGFSEKKGTHYEKPQVYNAFEQDFSNFRKLKIQTQISANKNKKVKIFLDDVLLYQTSYEEPIGEIYGISFHFRNTYGIVKNLELSSESIRHNFSFNP